MENRCVTCGAVIPEGLQVCHACERKAYAISIRTMDRAETLDKLRRIHATACGLSRCTRVMGMPVKAFLTVIANAIWQLEEKA